MINTNELRRGNYLFKDKVELVKVTGISGKSVEVWLGLTPETRYEEIDHMGKMSYVPDLLSGIPLTSEWLHKLGFITNGASKRLATCAKTELCYYESENKVRWQTLDSGWTRNMNIEYVHQLQNLYYSLTGEELKIL